MNHTSLVNVQEKKRKTGHGKGDGISPEQVEGDKRGQTRTMTKGAEGSGTHLPDNRTGKA
jgi:hypothetical protein